MAYKELIEEHSLTHEGCAEALGVDRSKVTNTIRLLSLPEKALDSLVEDKITMGHARSLLSLKENPPLLLEVLSLVLEKGLSVRQTESVCRKLKKQGEGNKAKTLDQERTNPNIEYYADILRQELKTKVKLTGSGGRGKIEISYFSLAEFERLFEVFCGKKL